MSRRQHDAGYAGDGRGLGVSQIGRERRDLATAQGDDIVLPDWAGREHGSREDDRRNVASAEVFPIERLDLRHSILECGAVFGLRDAMRQHFLEDGGDIRTTELCYDSLERGV